MRSRPVRQYNLLAVFRCVQKVSNNKVQKRGHRIAECHTLAPNTLLSNLITILLSLYVVFHINYSVTANPTTTFPDLYVRSNSLTL